MPSENPFVYGEVVPPAAFTDRDAELARLVADLEDGQKVFLISPRRFGKSSLVRQALRLLRRRQVASVEITVSSYSSYVAFLEGYVRAVLSLEREAAAARSWIERLLGPLRPQVTPRPARRGRPALDVAFPAVRTARDVARLADEVFALPGRLADLAGRRLVIALDEFQDVARFDGGSIEQALRAAVQHQRRVGYVFAGSEPSLMERMVGPRRPFYKAGPVLRLDRIPGDVFAAFVEDRFRSSGLRADPGLGAAIVDLAGNLPYDVQRLAHETWDDARAAGRRRVGSEDLYATLHRLLDEHAVFFEAAWQRLTLAQRAALRAVVLEDGRGLLSGDARVRHRLGGASSVQAALAALRREDLVARDESGRYWVVDSLFREWVARTTY
jgi:hypothetical protein